MALNVGDENFQREVLEAEIPVLVDFWASWCMPCKMLAPIIDEVSQEYQGKLKVCKVNVEEAALTASHYAIMTIPTIAIFKEGKIIDTSTGVLPKKDLVAKISAHLT